MSDIYDIWLCPLHDRWHKFHVHGTNRKFHYLPSDKEYPPPSLVNMQGVPPMDALLQDNCT